MSRNRASSLHLVKKTTILFPPYLPENLVKLAKRRATSLGQLVRVACEAQHGAASIEDRLEALKRLVGLKGLVRIEP